MRSKYFDYRVMKLIILELKEVRVFGDYKLCYFEKLTCHKKLLIYFVSHLRFFGIILLSSSKLLAGINVKTKNVMLWADV